MAAENDTAGGGLFQKLISIFTGGGDPEREKRRLLKEIAKELKKQKYKFYKPKTKEAQPGLAKWIFSYYKLLGPANVMLQNIKESGAIKTILIESFLEEKQLDRLQRFDEDAIRAAVEKTEIKKVAATLKEELVSFFAAFDSETVKKINSTYNRLLVFLQVIDFDYYFMLKKFDSGLPERNFSYSPNFDSINGDYISDDLQDLLSVMHLVDAEADWDAVFDALHNYKGQDVLNRDEWKKAVKALIAIRKSNILLLIVKHLQDDPQYKVMIYPPQETIVEAYLNKLKTQVEMTIQKLLQEKRNSKIDGLAIKIFGTPAISRMKYYTEKANMVFSKKMLGGFIYLKPTNYLKAFLLDFVKKDLKSIIDILLIRGEWTTNVMSQQLSESFHHLLELSDQLLQFDETLAEEGEMGSKLKTLMGKADRDPNSMSVLKKLIKECNDKASLIIKNSAQNLIIVAKNLKLCIDDYMKQPHEMLVNWKELEAAFDNRVKESISDVYKMIYNFIQLLQFFLK